MPKNQITKDELKIKVLKLKNRVDNEHAYPGEKAIVHKYLNEVLFIIEQYRY
jgi:hypothetical protein